jgi:hypothetical protein
MIMMLRKMRGTIVEKHVSIDFLAQWLPVWYKQVLTPHQCPHRIDQIDRFRFHACAILRAAAAE